MKLFIPIGSFFPAEIGGPSLSVYWLSRSLQQNGQSVQIVTTAMNTYGLVPVDQWINKEYGRVIYLSKLSYFFPIRFLFYILPSILRTDTILITSVFVKTNLLLIMCSTIFRKKVIISIRGELDEEALKNKYRFKKIYLHFYKRILPKSYTLHSTSPRETASIRQIFPCTDKLIELPNFIEVPLLVTTDQVYNYLLYLGRFHPIKAVDRILKALAGSEEFLNSNLKMMLAGDVTTDYGKAMQTLAIELGLGDKVMFIGEVKGLYKEELLANAKVTIIASHTENFCNVVLESLCQSTPVIASTGTPWSILNEAQVGFCIENSVDSITHAIDQVLQLDSESYLRMRKKAREFAIAEFDIKKGIKKWIEVLENIQ